MVGENKHVLDAFMNLRSHYLQQVGELWEMPNVKESIMTSFRSPNDVTAALIFLKTISDYETLEISDITILNIFEVALGGSITNIAWARIVLREINLKKLETLLSNKANATIDKLIAVDGAEWIYRRLLELYDDIGSNLLFTEVIKLCEQSNEQDLNELIEDFSNRRKWW